MYMQLFVICPYIEAHNALIKRAYDEAMPLEITLIIMNLNIYMYLKKLFGITLLNIKTFLKN